MKNTFIIFQFVVVQCALGQTEPADSYNFHKGTNITAEIPVPPATVNEENCAKQFNATLFVLKDDGNTETYFPSHNLDVKTCEISREEEGENPGRGGGRRISINYGCSLVSRYPGGKYAVPLPDTDGAFTIKYGYKYRSFRYFESDRECSGGIIATRNEESDPNQFIESKTITIKHTNFVFAFDATKIPALCKDYTGTYDLMTFTNIKSSTTNPVANEQITFSIDGTKVEPKTTTLNNIATTTWDFLPSSLDPGEHTLFCAIKYDNGEYQFTTKVNVIGEGTSGLIAFDTEKVKRLNDKNYFSLCTGDPRYRLFNLVTPNTGTWEYFSGIKVGLDAASMDGYYSPTNDNFTENEPNVLKYTATVNGCRVSDYLNIWVKDNRSTPEIIGIPPQICSGESFPLTGNVPGSNTGTYTYQFMDEATNTILARTQVGYFGVEKDTKISLRSINQYGCKSGKVFAQIKTPVGDKGIIADRTTANVNEFIQFSSDAPATSVYIWDFGDGTIPKGNVQNPKKYYYKPGNYLIKLEITGNSQLAGNKQCYKDYTLPIQIKGEVPEIVTALESNEEGIFPNPTTNTLNLIGKWVNNLSDVTIISTIGTQQKLPIANGSVDVSSLSPGVYILKGGSTSYKFVKK